MSDFPYGAKRFSLSRQLAIESTGGQSVVLYHTDTNRRVQIHRRLFDLLMRFREPQSLRDGVADTGIDLPAVQNPLEQLIRKEFLVCDDCHNNESETLSNRVTVFPTMYRAPLRGSHQPDADIAIVGVSYDAGNIVNPGARRAPGEIRKRSTDQEYRIDIYTGSPLGWYDVDRKERILEGVTIADWGDVAVHYGESPEKLFSRIQSVCAEILDTGAIPAVLGGDHSITFGLANALQIKRELQVVWLDAHTDSGDLKHGDSPNHKNVVTRILQLPNVKQVINVGHRGYTCWDKSTISPSGLSIVTAAEVRRLGPSALTEHLLPGIPCQVSVDIDVLDPIYAPGTSTPCPGGLTPTEVKDVVRELGQRCRIVGCDLVEVNPFFDPTSITLIQAHQLLSVCLGAAIRSRKLDAPLGQHENHAVRR